MKMKTAARVSFLTLVFSALLMTLCGWTSGCDAPIKKASAATYAIASTLHTAADLNHELAASGMITVEERKQVALAIDQVSQANDVLIAQLRAASANGGQVTAASVATAFDQFLVQLDALEQNGVLHIKSDAAKARFETQINLVRQQVKILQLILGSTSGSNERRLPIPAGMPLACAGLLLTAEEIEQLISLAVSALGEGALLVSKLRSMAGKSAEELLIEAEAEDADARKQARADE